MIYSVVIRFIVKLFGPKKTVAHFNLHSGIYVRQHSNGCYTFLHISVTKHGPILRKAQYKMPLTHNGVSFLAFH